MQASPSSHAVVGGAAAGWQSPVAGVQALVVQASAPPLGQVTTVAGLTLHTGGFAATSQYSVPLQASPSSFLRQSALVAHVHTLSPPGAQTPDLQASPTVQPSSSLHALPSLLATFAHVPVLGWQTES